VAGSWQGDGELFVYRDDARVPVRLDLQRKPDRPDRRGRWAGTFAAKSLTVLTPGRGTLFLPGGAEAEVMVEGYDVVTGRGDLIGLDTAPF
jgi:hypothetical protein